MNRQRKMTLNFSDLNASFDLSLEPKMNIVWSGSNTCP